MEISPAVQPPKVGDPITAKWASDLSAAVNSSAHPAEDVGSVSSPFGKASPVQGLPMLGDFRAPMPFDCAVGRPSGASVDSLYCYLPPYADRWRSYVFVDADPCEASASQTLGTDANPWVEVGQLTAGDSYALVLAFEDITPTPDPDDGAAFKWRLSLSNGVLWTIVPSWASWKAPPVIVAQVLVTTRGGVNRNLPCVLQYVRGGVNVGGSGWILGSNELGAYGSAVGNSSKSKVLDLDDRKFTGGTWEAASGNMKFGSYTLAPVTITDGGGVSYTVLGKLD